MDRPDPGSVDEHVADEVFTLIAGGKAGYGIRKAGSVAARLFARMGRHVFQMDDYPSLIRGGHNFFAVSTATGPLTSHYLKADLLVCLDQRSVDAHQGNMSPRGVMVLDDKARAGEGSIGLPFSTAAKKYSEPDLITGVAVAAVLAAAIGMSEEELTNLIAQEYRRGTEENTAYARSIFSAALPVLAGRFKLEGGDKERPILSGNEAIALGAVAAGLDIFFAYPMTPASSILTFLAARAGEFGTAVVHPENEIGVMNMAIGAATAGARAMVASSGGGFALMQEAFSLAGMAEVPLLCVLSSRPGPSTGLPTYTSQGDLNFALNQGHGEFPRVVASPGSVEEAYLLVGELMSLAWEFQTPAILLTEKHLSECHVTTELETGKAAWPEPVAAPQGPYHRYLDAPTGVSPLAFPPSAELIKWNSYEHDEDGFTTEDAVMSARMADKRRRKGEILAAHLRTLHTVNTWATGHDRNPPGIADRVPDAPVILTYGSTTLSVLEALRCGGIEATVVQPVFLEPLPVWELSRYAHQDVTVVEQSSTGLFASLLKEKAGITATRVIKRYDGRPFAPEELAAELKS
jgi:2-oxoglutarate/2-oxoacid ferredoxin oxidoreductase subunit alpha